MHHVRQYRSGKVHYTSLEWLLRLHECAGSMMELAEKYYPPAVRVAEVMSHIGHQQYEAFLAKNESVIKGYLAAMNGRAVETSRHYVLHGTMFISHYVVTLQFKAKKANLSPGPGDWFCIKVGETQHLRTYDLTLALTKVAADIDRALIDPAAPTYPNWIPRDIRNIIAEYIGAPAAHLATLV